ncbi:glutamyl-tRNA(Gln) amidotransferase subunit A [Striga asiatica]|uniref:Glutamyl-tRNA(Gln) amidotransferase subunit A n=1 Tax=Striga asiatica TaxID=4170 RepID=A0A5A7RBS5_STRAF|nr:glutamyl-tRNA(Gln) amidotransferase subunit A [Striga asiatica]
MKALDQEDKQAVSDTDIFEEEVESGSAAKRKVETDDASLVASIAKRQETSYADVETSDADATIVHNVKETFIEFRCSSTLGRKDEDMKVELAKHFRPGSDEYKKALGMVGSFLQRYCKAGNSDDVNSREVIVESVFCRDGRLLTSFMY